MENKSKIIMDAYEQANADAIEILSYVESISKPVDLKESSLPSLVKHLENQESEVSKKYSNFATTVGGTVATAVATSIAGGMITTGGLSVGAMSVGALIPGLNILSISVVGIPLAFKLLDHLDVKRYIKNNELTMKQKRETLKKYKEKLTHWLTDLQQRMEELDEVVRKEVSDKFSEYKEKTKKLSQDISIQIDDCININTNKRILLYNEVILNQYKLQRDLEEKVDFLFDEYNKVQDEKDKLKEQIICLVKLLNAMNCPEAVINQALEVGV